MLRVQHHTLTTEGLIIILAVVLDRFGVVDLTINRQFAPVFVSVGVTVLRDLSFVDVVILRESWC